jgi:hypothetical protein
VGSSYFNGIIDDLRIYSGDLKEAGTDLEVTAIYSGGYGDFNKIRIVGTGSTDITANQPGSPSFAPALPVTKTITVSKQNQTITFNPFPPKSVGDFDFDPGAVASSTLPISYSSSDSSIAEIVGVDGPDSDFLPDPGTQKIRVRKAGTVTITANQAGDSIYNPATAVTQTLTINYYNLFESSISGMQWWFDAYNVNADTSPDIATDTGVSGGFQWNDLSSNNYNAVQTDSAKYFTYVPNGLDGKGTIQFDAADTLDFGPVSGTKMVFTVIKQDGAQSAETSPFGGDLVGTTSAGKWGLKRSGTGILDSGIASNGFAVICYQVEGGAYILYVNGVNMGEGTDSQTISALDKLGGTLKGEIAEAVAYNRVLPGLAREKIEGYLAHKWGLDGALPTTHKYKVALPTFGGAQEIAFQPISDKTPASAPFTVFAESSSGLPVTFDSNDTTRATVSGNTVTMASGATPGKVGIRATQAGNTNWFPVQFTQTLIVTETPRSDQYITFNALPSKNALDADFSLSAVSKRVDNNATTGLTIAYTSSNSAVASISGSTVSIHGTGVATIRASQAGDNNYNPASFVERDLTITKVPQTISFNPISQKLLSQGTFVLDANASSGLTVSYVISDTSIAEVSGNVVTLKAGGTTNITASQTGNSTYDAATAVTQTLTVQDDSLDPQTITWTQNLSSLSFGDADLTMTATATSNLAITYSSSDETVVKVVNSNKLQTIGAGSATVTASQPGNAEWQAASMDKNVTVSKANQEIKTTAGNATLPNFTGSDSKDSGDFVFGGHIHAVRSGTNTPSGLAISYVSSNPAVVEVVSGGTKLKIKGGGTSTITVSQAGSIGYNPASSKTFTINVTEYSPYPDSITGMTAWFDANDVNGDGLSETAADFISVSSKTQVGVWADRSGSNNPVAQSNQSLQPVYSQANGKNALVFGGSNGNVGAHLSGWLPSSLTGNPALTVIVAAKSNATTGSKRLIQFGSGLGTANQVLGLAENGTFEYNAGGLSFQSPPSFGSSAHVAVFRREKDSLNRRGEFIMDGAKQGLAGVASGTINLPSSGGIMTVASGKMSNGTMSSFEGDIYEIIVASKSLNDFAIRRLEGYLAHKWGGVSNLALTHPFKVSRPLFGGSQSIYKETNPAIHGMPIDTASGLPVMSVHDDPFDLKGSYATSGLDLVYTSSNPAVLMVTTDGKLKGQTAGTVTVTMSQPGDNYFSAAPVNQTMQLKIIGDYPQVITFDEIAETAKNATLDLNATSSRGLPVSYKVTSGAALVNQTDSNDFLTTNSITFSGVGDVTIRAIQDGNATTAAASPIDRSFKVKWPVNILFDPIGLMGNGQVFTIKASVRNAITGQVFDKGIAPTPVFSVVSGPATVSGNTVTCGTTNGDVTIRAIVQGPLFMTTQRETTFTLDASKLGQVLHLAGEDKGQKLRDLPLGRKPIMLGHLFKSSSGLPVSISLNVDGKIAKIVGDPGKQMIAFAPKGGGMTKNDFDKQDAKGRKYLTVTLTARQLGDGSYHAAAPITRDFIIKPPSKDAFFEQRRMDKRFDTKRDSFKNKVAAKLGLSGEKADYLFDSDDFDSDGDGVSNLLERAFGGDSLSNDARDILPKRFTKSDGYEYISFSRYTSDFNTGDDQIEYIVETSSDLRTWDANGAELVSGTASDLGGGMERVVFKSKNPRPTDGRMFIRVRVKAR